MDRYEKNGFFRVIFLPKMKKQLYRIKGQFWRKFYLAMMMVSGPIAFMAPEPASLAVWLKGYRMIVGLPLPAHLRWYAIAEMALRKVLESLV